MADSIDDIMNVVEQTTQATARIETLVSQIDARLQARASSLAEALGRRTANGRVGRNTVGPLMMARTENKRALGLLSEAKNKFMTARVDLDG